MLLKEELCHVVSRGFVAGRGSPLEMRKRKTKEEALLRLGLGFWDISSLVV